MHPMINIAIKAARQASRTLLQHFDQLDRIRSTEKKRNDWVTEADTTAEQIIIEHIQKAYPTHSVIGEESGPIQGDEYCWLIDPLDGTANFIHGIPHFAISIAVTKQNELYLAMIYDPIRNELFTAERGNGAYMNNQRLRVSSTHTLENALLGTGFPFRDPHLMQPYLATLTALLPHCSDVRRAGSAALDLAYVACSRLDGFWEASLNAWDIAAGSLLIQEAGGVLCDFNGEKNFLTEGSVIASNPKLFKALSTHILTSLHANQT